MKIFRNAAKAYALYKFFEKSKNSKKQPSKFAKFRELYRGISTR
jgi:hypothetical protein